MNPLSQSQEAKLPKYQQVAHRLLGDWERDGRRSNSTQKQLAEQYGVHLLTLRHALQWLEQSGKLERLSSKRIVGEAASPTLIGFPIWADSLTDLDPMRIDGRLRMARSIATELAANGYKLDLQFVGPKNSPNLMRIRELSRQWSAVVLEPFSGESEITPRNPFYPMLDRAALIGAFQGVQHHCVCTDLYEAGQLAVAEFARLNVRRILYTGRRDELSAHQFLRIVSAETAACRHPDIEILYAEGGFHTEEAFSAVKRFFRDGGHCDGIFAGSNYAAIGAIRALADLGIQCPDEVQIIAIGWNSISPFLTPRLTTILAEPNRMGEEVARMAIHLTQPDAPPRPNILVPVHLVHGETTRQSSIDVDSSPSSSQNFSRHEKRLVPHPPVS